MLYLATCLHSGVKTVSIIHKNNGQMCAYIIHKKYICIYILKVYAIDIDMDALLMSVYLSVG